MRGKHILLSVILVLVILVSSSLFIIQKIPPDNPPYTTIYLRDYTMNTYKLEYIANQQPTSSSYDSRYTEAVHRYHERLNLAKDRVRIEQKRKETEWLLE